MNTLLTAVTEPVAVGVMGFIKTITDSAKTFVLGLGDVINGAVQIIYKDGAVTDIGLIALVFMGISVSFMGLKFVMGLLKK